MRLAFQTVLVIAVVLLVTLVLPSAMITAIDGDDTAQGHAQQAAPASLRLIHRVDHARRGAQGCRRRLTGRTWPVAYLERHTVSVPLRRWVLHRWARRASVRCSLLRGVLAARRAQSPVSAICAAFGSECGKAVRVARCESGLSVHAVGGGGLYYGLFQFGAYARKRYGFAWDARTQANAAAAMWRDGGWRPWPICGQR